MARAKVPAKDPKCLLRESPDHLLMHQLDPRYLCLLRAESQGAHLQPIEHSSIIGVIHHRFSKAKVARGRAVTWDALIICSCIGLVHDTFARCGQDLRGFICS